MVLQEERLYAGSFELLGFVMQSYIVKEQPKTRVFSLAHRKTITKTFLK